MRGGLKRIIIMNVRTYADIFGRESDVFFLEEQALRSAAPAHKLASVGDVALLPFKGCLLNGDRHDNLFLCFLMILYERVA